MDVSRWRLASTRESVIKPVNLRSRRWTRHEVAIWFSALIVAITLDVLVLINVLGSWALAVVSVIALGVAVMRYRAENRP